MTRERGKSIAGQGALKTTARLPVTPTTVRRTTGDVFKLRLYAVCIKHEVLSAAAYRLSSEDVCEVSFRTVLAIFFALLGRSSSGISSRAFCVLGDLNAFVFPKGRRQKGSARRAHRGSRLRQPGTGTRAQLARQRLRCNRRRPQGQQLDQG